MARSTYLRLFGTILLMAIVLSAGACGSSTPDSTSSSQPAENQQNTPPDSQAQLFAAIEANAPYVQNISAATYAKTPISSRSGAIVPGDAQSAIGLFESGHSINQSIDERWNSFRASLQEEASASAVFYRADIVCTIAYLDYQKSGDTTTVEALFCYSGSFSPCTSDRLVDVHLNIVLEPRYWKGEYVDLQVTDFEILDYNVVKR